MTLASPEARGGTHYLPPTDRLPAFHPANEDENGSCARMEGPKMTPLHKDALLPPQHEKQALQLRHAGNNPEYSSTNRGGLRRHFVMGIQRRYQLLRCNPFMFLRPDSLHPNAKLESREAGEAGGAQAGSA